MSTLTGDATRVEPRTNDQSMATAYPYKVKRRRLWVIPVLLLVGVGMVSGAWAALDWARTQKEIASLDRFTVTPRSFSVVLKEKGELKAAKSADIICEVEGRSTIISLIPEGTPVKKGDLLVELASDAIEDRIRQEELKEANAITAVEVAKTLLDIQRDKNLSDIRKAELAIELARLELEKYQKGNWEQSQKDAQIAIDQATILLDRRKEDFEAAKELYARNFITKTEYDEAEFNYQKAIWDLEKAHKAKEVLETYTHVADLRQKQADYDEAKKEYERVVKNAEAEELQKLRSLEGKEKELQLVQEQLGKFRVQRERCKIYAPTQGFVVYYSEGGRFWSSDQQIREGATVHERQVLLSLPDTAEMQVIVRVHEAKTNKLKLGQPATVTVEGIPGKIFSGRVTKIAALADTQNRWLNPDLKEYETEITLDSTETQLKPGVTAYTEILVENVDDRLAVPVQSVYAQGGRRFVFVPDGTLVSYREVTVGAIGTEWAEIQEGVTEGEKILLAFSDEHKRLIPEVPRGSGPHEAINGQTPSNTSVPVQGDRRQRRTGTTTNLPAASGKKGEALVGTQEDGSTLTTQDRTTVSTSQETQESKASDAAATTHSADASESSKSSIKSPTS
jgi:HlyD family secretion protein